MIDHMFKKFTWERKQVLDDAIKYFKEIQVLREDVSENKDFWRYLRFIDQLN